MWWGISCRPMPVSWGRRSRRFRRKSGARSFSAATGFTGSPTTPWSTEASWIANGSGWENASVPLTSFLRLDAIQHVVERVVVELVAEARLARRGDVAVLVDAELVLEVRAVGGAHGLRRFEPDVVGHGQLAMEVDDVVQQVAPIVRQAQHAETLRHLGDLHAAGDAAQVIDDEPP